MINTKVTNTKAKSTEERVLALLESIDWKLWEMMNMMKTSSVEQPVITKAKNDN